MCQRKIYELLQILFHYKTASSIPTNPVLVLDVFEYFSLINSAMFYTNGICLAAVLLVSVALTMADPSESDCDVDWLSVASNGCTEKQAVPLNSTVYCRWFCICQDNKYTPQECYLGRYYNPNSQKCDYNSTYCHTSPAPPTPSPKPKEPCSKEDEGKKRAASDCHQFQVCTEGFWGDAQSCSYGFYFNSKNSDCEYNTMCIHCNCL